MGLPKRLKGKMTSGDDPNWEPLKNVLADGFMWMYAVTLEDGQRVEAYKHIDTRQYIHADDQSRTWAYSPPHWYVEVDPTRVTAAVFEPTR